MPILDYFFYICSDNIVRYLNLCFMRLKHQYCDLIRKLGDLSTDLVISSDLCKNGFTPEDFNDWLIAVRTFNFAFSGLSLDDVVEDENNHASSNKSLSESGDEAK